MKKCFYILTILALLLQPAQAFLPVALAQEGGDKLQTLVDSILYAKPVATGTGDCFSWDNACELQTAIANSVSGDQIWVTAGTYTPTDSNDRMISFSLKNGVAIYGGFSGTETLLSERDWETNLTILSGDIGTPDDTADNSYHVVYGSGITTAALLDGFTITRGNANYVNSHWAWGGGMYILNSNVKIQNVTFEYNTANGGGGMFSDGNLQPVVLENVQFNHNISNMNGAGMHTYNGSSPELNDVTFFDNDAHQAGGGMYNSTNSSSTLHSTDFIYNRASTHGGGMYNTSNSDPILVNVIFSANSASANGGGVFNTNSSDPQLLNVTFNGNTAINNGQSIFNQTSSKPTIRNSILWGSGQQIYNASTTSYISYSDIQGSGGSLNWNASLGTNNGGNIDADPLFMDADGADGIPGTDDDDFHLKRDSAAIEVGSNIDVPALDFDGNPRLDGDRVDMGAYEFQYPQPPSIIYVDQDPPGNRSGENWTDALTRLPFAIAWAKTAVMDGTRSFVEIWVAKGTYKPNAVRQDSIQLQDGVHLYGSFIGYETTKDGRNFTANASILSGDLRGDDGLGFVNYTENSIHVVSGGAIATEAVMDGFTIKGGNANGVAPWEWGGGIYLENSKATIRNAVIEDNFAKGGGGMFINGGGQSVVLSDIHFRQNKASVNGGGLHTYLGSNPILTDVDFFSNQAIQNGGGMINWSSSPTLNNVTFTANYAASGAGMYNQDSNPILNFPTFTYNIATSNGGGMYNTNSSPEINSTSYSLDFDSNTAVNGGGMFNTNQSSPDLTKVAFSGNTASQSGGGMYNYLSSPTMRDAEFLDNTANTTGGGMFNTNQSSPDLTKVAFSGNTASQYGGGMYNYNSSPTLLDVTFSGNTATANGGGMLNTNSSPSLTDVTFSENTADEGGGMDNDYYGNPTLVNVTFSGNIADEGGGMYNGSNSIPSLTAVNFINNTASASGGGVYNYTSSPSLSDVTFSGNTASANGGGMYNHSSSPSLTSVNFNGNSGSAGGGMYNYTSSPSLSDVTFNDNTASANGGGMCNNASSNPTLSNVTFSSNTASTMGGGMYSFSSDPILTGITFSGNTAATGGGVYSQDSSLQILQTTFYTNTASTAGGGIYNNGCTAQKFPTLVNVLFNANQATDEINGKGGGLYNDNCPAVLTNVTLVHNHAGLYGGGVFATGSYLPMVHNSLFWGNTASGTTADQQFHGSTDLSNTTIQQSDADPSPFIDAAGPDGIPGTLDDDLHPTYPSAYADGAVIDGGVEADLPSDSHDLDGDSIVTEKLPVDLDGHPRIYADNDLDGTCDPVTTLETDGLDQVDRGAYETGCWAWHMQTGNKSLVDGRDYRLGFHDEIDKLATVTISQTLSAYTLERSDGNLEEARQSFGIAIECAATLTESHQATLGMLDAIWEQATGAMLEGNEQMVQVLDVTGSGASDNETSQLIQARELYHEAVLGYLEPLASDDYPSLLETLAISRTNPITYTTETSLVDLERLLKASAGKSRAALELGERQFRGGQKAQAEQTLQQGAFQAQLEMDLVYTLWPEAAETEDYIALLRNIADMDRLYGYIVSGKNPLGYDSDYIPFSYDYEHPNANNYLQTWYIAGRDLEAAETAVTAAAGKQKEVDDDYQAMQTRLSEVRTYYNGILVGLCGTNADGLPDREHCAGGDIQEQVDVVENAMLQVERVLLQMDNQNALIRIEQQRVATEAGIRYATAQLITDNGEKIADYADQEANLRFSKSTAQGILGIVQGFINGGFSGSGSVGTSSGLSVGMGLIGGVIGGVTAALDWKFQADVARDIGNVVAKKERLYAAQQAAVQYAEGDIASANSLALQRQYMLKFAELDVDLAIMMNNLQKELAHLVNLRNQAEYALAEQAKAEAFTSLLYRDPAGRIVRERYMEMAHYSYEDALDSGFKAGKALAYEMNDDVTYTGLPLTSLDDIYPLQDVNLMAGALEQMDDAYIDWLGIVHAPTVDTYNEVYLSLAVGFDDDSTSSREEKFNAFIRDPAQRTDRDADGCPEVEFTFQTSIETGNKLGLYTTVFNDKIKSLQMRIYGTDLFYGDERQSVAGIRLKQAGSSMLRTRFSQIPGGGVDDLSFYNLDPWTITIQAAVNENTLPSPNTGLASRSVAATMWTINIEGGAGVACGDLNLDNIGDIRLYISHEYYDLQTGMASTGQVEAPTIRPYQPMRRYLPTQSLASLLNEADSRNSVTSIADNDLSGLFVGTVVITQPLYLPPVELFLQLTDLSGSITGYISPTLTFPVIPGSDHGPTLSGSWSGSSFSLTAEPFVSFLITGIPITRTIQFEDGLITSTEITRTLSGSYIEILEGLTPEPLETRGIFRLERPLRPLQAWFGASPRSVFVGDNVFFTDGSLGNPVSWSWTFGDGGTSALQNPLHAYAAPGEYTVSLTISDGAGQHTHTETGFISVMSPSAPPQASFTASPISGTVPLQVSFQDHSYGGPTSWQWNFGDGSTSTQRNPTHTYTQEGVFTVSLTVSNQFGSDTYTWVDAITTVTVEMSEIYLPIISKK